MNCQWSRCLLHFKHRGNRCRCAQFQSAFTGRTSTCFQAELTRFERQLSIIIIERHHRGGECKFQGAAFTGFECDSLEANKMMDRDYGRSLEIAQVKLGDFGGVPSATIAYGQADVERVPQSNIRFIES